MAAESNAVARELWTIYPTILVQVEFNKFLLINHEWCSVWG